MEIEEKERFLRASNAMKALGISAKELKPVLLNLLDLFDWNWELVEAEDYRALIDAYFESKENEGLEDKTGGLMKCDGSEGPSKKFHLGGQEDRASVAKAKCSKMLAMQKNKMPITNSRDRIMESSQPLLGDRRTGLNSQCPYEQNSCKREDMMKSHLAPSNRKTTYNGASTVSSKQLLDAHGSCYSLREDVPTSYCKRKLIMSKTDKPISVDLSEGTPVSLPGQSVKSLVSQDVHIDNKDGALAGNDSTRSKSNFDIASSALGEVKLSLQCNVATGDRNFISPSYDAVLKHIEYKYLRSDKIKGPQFSVKKLLTDLCDSYLELGNKSAGASVTNYSSQLGTKAGEYCSPAGQNKRASRVGNIESYLNKMVSKHSACLNSSSLVNVQNPPATYDKKRPFRRISDITKGSENVKISLVADTSNEDLPKFTYIPHNIIYQNAYVHFSLARIADEDCCSSCSGDCLSLSIPCACARETGGEFAYTPQGMLKEEFLGACMSLEKGDKQHLVYCQDCPIETSKNEFFPEKCKGHVVKKFIKECWRKCGCNMQCGNRVVQRGITCKLEVFLTRGGKGWGLRTLQDLPKGTFVCEYVGEIVTNLELYERNMQSGGNDRHTYPVTLDADWGSEKVLRDEEALCLDATYCGNVARFINHRCFDANLINIPVEVETPDRHYYHLAFFTKRRVDALEELTWDYGIDFSDHDHPIKAFQCCCGSAFCRDLEHKS